MKQEYKEKWLAALKSGDYCYTSSVLYQDGCFCALGVLCEVVEPNLARKATAALEGVSETLMEKLFKGGGGLMPSKVYDITGITATDENDVFRLNDLGEKPNYDEVIVLIERHL